MNGVGDAHAAAAAAAMVQQTLGMSLPMAAFVPEQCSANKLTRPPGLPPLPQAFVAQQRGDVCMEAADPAAGPRKAHRRSRSDVPFGYFPPQGHHQLPPPKVEAGWGGGDDDLFNAYLNLEGLDGLNSSDDRLDDGDSRGSSMRTNGADSSENDSDECAAAGPPVAHHVRSLSMDSSLIGKLNFSAGAAAANGGVIPGPNRFSLEFGSGEFTPVEMNKIMADEKLAEMALADPKRVKR